MSPINLVILRSLFIFFQMFITPATAVVYSRDQLLSLRSRTQLLDTDQSSLIMHLRIGRRGCRAGNHWRRRLLAAHSVTSSVSCMTTCREIPTIIGHRGMFTNKNDQPVPVSAPDHRQPNNDVINSAVNLAASGTAAVATDRSRQRKHCIDQRLLVKLSERHGQPWN